MGPPSIGGLVFSVTPHNYSWGAYCLFSCFVTMERIGTRMDGPLGLIARPHLLVSGHQRTVSTSKGCNQWLSLAKTLLKVALDGGNRSLVACTSKCGWAITKRPTHTAKPIAGLKGNDPTSVLL